jgi:hypothetical protein
MELIPSENVAALSCHLSMGIASKKLVKRTGLPIAIYNQEFHWKLSQHRISAD